MILLLMLAAQAEPPSTEPRGVGTEIVAVHRQSRVPSRIMPAMLPYISCLTGENQVGPRRPVEDEDCAGQRAVSAAAADALLRREGRLGARARAEMIEAALVSIDEAIGPAAIRRMTEELNARGD